MKNPCIYCLLAVLSLILAGCFQPVDLGETYVEKGTAHLRVTNVSADSAYILEGLELRNAEGAAVWENLNLSKGQSCEVNTEMAGTFTLWYRVKDTWISASEIKPYEGGQVEIVLNKSHEFSFEGGAPDAAQDDFDNDGYPDAWERENGFDPEDPGDGGPVYVGGSNGQDTNRGTPTSPYLTLAKAVAKAGRGLSPDIRTVVVMGELTLLNGGNGPNNLEYKGRDDSVFYLGKTRNRVTIRGESDAALKADGSGGKRVLYLDTGADIALRDITITGGKGGGGGIYASDAKLSLESGAIVENNNGPADNLTGIAGGGIYMERGTLVMEPGSFVRGNWAYGAGGIRLAASRFDMNGGEITANHAKFGVGGLSADGSTIVMRGGAISANIEGDTVMGDAGGGASIGLFSDFTMYGGSITDNVANSGFGAGIYVTGESKLIMKDGEISGNVCTHKTGDPNTGRGGGVMVVNGASFTMEGGKIAGNTAGRVGGGLYLSESNTKFTMLGGTIYGNNPIDPNDKNEAQRTDTDPKGHAIYDARPGGVAVRLDYDDDVDANTFP
jgi:hypothetical protein